MDEYQQWGINERVLIELALSEYEARLNDLSPDPRERYIDRLCHKVEGAEGDTERLRVVVNMQKQIPALFEPASPAFRAIWERFFGVIETLTEAEKLALTAEAYAERKDAFLAGLGEDDRRLLEAEPAERDRKSWENLTGYLNGHRLYMYLPFLIEAVSLRFERTGDGEGVLRRLDSLQDADPEGASTAKDARTPGGFRGFCIEKIIALPEPERMEFLMSKQTGPQDLDHYGREWLTVYNSTAERKVKGYTSTVSHAKKEARKRLNID